MYKAFDVFYFVINGHDGGAIEVVSRQHRQLFKVWVMIAVIMLQTIMHNRMACQNGKFVITKLDLLYSYLWIISIPCHDQIFYQV